MRSCVAILSLLKRKPPVLVEQQPAEPVTCTRQQNIKVSEDCSVAFAALAKAQGISKAALFEDMVAERLETAQRRGLEVEFRSGRGRVEVAAVGDVMREERWSYPPDYVSAETLAYRLDCSRSTIDTYVRSGVLPKPRALAICSAGTSDKSKPSSRRKMLRHTKLTDQHRVKKTRI